MELFPIKSAGLSRDEKGSRNSRVVMKGIVFIIRVNIYGQLKLGFICVGWKAHQEPDRSIQHAADLWINVLASRII
ncbi:hypothetical protein FQZ97_1039940 [compost metagenome]